MVNIMFQWFSEIVVGSSPPDGEIIERIVQNFRRQLVGTTPPVLPARREYSTMCGQSLICNRCEKGGKSRSSARPKAWPNVSFRCAFTGT